ncbi:MAG: cysteine protease StiP family protein [Lachnospiraceae bacterium]|nr:cysteine protease StiP family protein [Lachnospiraceae bacterium]
MRSSYLPEDVVLLLKDITGLVQPQPTEEREKLIQSGRHYSEMLPVEYVPTEKYMEVYREALGRYAKQVADAVGVLADKIIAARGKDVVLVSLARAGTPIGILIRRFIKGRYGVDVPHYSISIIRGRGIDDNAMKYLLEIYKPEQLLFVDGWIGKGAILSELEKDVKAYPHVSPEIAVVADPAGVTELCGTHEDILIPSSCLNSTVSGLVSRTFLREDIIGEKDFHGAVFYEELRASDLSYEFIETIEKYFIPKEGNTCGQQEPVGAIREETGENQGVSGMPGEKPDENQGVSGMPGEKPDETQGASGMPGQESVKVREVSGGKGIDEVRKIAAFFGIEDINFVKPGIGETTRVLLRRVPWKVLIDERYRGAPELSHVVRLAEEKSVPVEYYPMAHYKCCGIIKKIADA